MMHVAPENIPWTHLLQMSGVGISATPTPLPVATYQLSGPPPVPPVPSTSSRFPPVEHCGCLHTHTYMHAAQSDPTVQEQQVTQLVIIMRQLLSVCVRAARSISSYVN